MDTLKKKYIISIIVCLLLLSFLFCNINFSVENEFEEFYFGVDVAYDDIDKIKFLVDQISNYSNFFIIGSTGITHNQAKLNQTIEILLGHDLDYSVFTAISRRLYSINKSVASSADDFLGIYYDDEFGGKQLDLDTHRSVFFADNYSDASAKFVDWIMYRFNGDFYSNNSESFLVPSDFRLVTSDYALYWFDYKAGYDVVLAQLGWNYSRQLNVALCRGAATVLDRDWGVIVTWTYNESPYLGSGEELFDDLVLAYENGAKYVMVFDSNKDYNDTTLTQAHLNAIERFWQYSKNNPRSADLLDGRVAYVLPKDWAYGFRGPDDKIWGLWEGDELVSGISETLGNLLDEYVSKLDIIYDDELILDNTYIKYIFWNGTTFTP